MDGAVPLGEGVHDGVDGALAPGQRPGEGPGQPEGPARVGQARGEQDRALLGEGAVDRVEPGGHGVDVEGAAQGVVDADDDGDDVGP